MHLINARSMDHINSGYDIYWCTNYKLFIENCVIQSYMHFITH